MSCSRHRLKIFKYATFIYWHLMSNLCPLVENSRACVAAILISQLQAWGLQEGEEIFQNIKIILGNVDLLPKKNLTQLKDFVSKAEFIARNLYTGKCSMGSFFATHVSMYFQWHAHQQHRQCRSILLRGDSWATPTSVFCKMKLFLYSHFTVLT